jgi:hypothetical protein
MNEEEKKNVLGELWKREMAGYIAARLRRMGTFAFSEKLRAEALAKAERLERGDYTVYDEPFGKEGEEEVAP